MDAGSHHIGGVFARHRWCLRSYHGPSSHWADHRILSSYSLSPRSPDFFLVQNPRSVGEMLGFYRQLGFELKSKDKSSLYR